MSIDNAPKRKSAVMARRLPWFRRFAPKPDGLVDAGDRAQMAFVYRRLAPAHGPAHVAAGAAWVPGVAAGVGWTPGVEAGGTWMPGVAAGSVEAE